MLKEILKEYWGFTDFRPLQEEIINTILSNKDCLAVLPTGGGKSLCYQLPALAKPGICLVISPLIALMKDQVESLRKKNITAFSIYSGMTRREVENTLKVSSDSNCKFLFVSPERLETTLFHEYLPGLPINLVAVDEAHCISQWGYDFRPSYLRLAELRDELPAVPFLALTASATPIVQKDICDKLLFGEHSIFRQSFERANLSYSCFKAESRINKIKEVLGKVAGPALVYCRSRKRTKEISDLLQLEGISADFYHAGLGREERNMKQDTWINDKTRVMVCTNAFGMGIDKPDVRIVIHADLPDCLENYYQEAGRAGRDGKTSFAVLLYDDGELEELKKLLQLRFPSPEDLRNMYRCIANYLQVPSGSGEGQYFDFDLPDFLVKFKLGSYPALYALKTLEQEGWIAFNEQVFLPPAVGFTSGKDELYEFEKNNPVLEPLIKALLRAYEGIFDRSVSISIRLIASMIRRSDEETEKQLTELHRYGMINYRKQKEKPQLLFLRPRIDASDLKINQSACEERKKRATERLRQLEQYATDQTICRSQFIGNYFGDKDISRCGVCDNCLRNKESPIGMEDFRQIQHRILNIIKYEPMPVAELLTRLNGCRKEVAREVLDFLQAEQKIELDASGRIRLR
jgi:ATP-dependent DNA helicase RecQ